MNQVFKEFAERFENNEIIKMKRKPNLHEIIVYANKDKFDSWSQLKRINELYDKYTNKSLQKKFVLTEIISVRKCYILTYIFSSKKIWRLLLLKKKMKIFFFFFPGGGHSYEAISFPQCR